MNRADLMNTQSFSIYGDKKRVLVVDSNNSIGNLLTRVLSMYLNLEIVKAQNSGQAVSEALTGSYEAAVIDMDGPAASALKTICTIRTMMPQFPIIAVSDDNSEANLRNLRRLGITDVVFKPFKMAALIERVSKIMRSGRTQSFAGQLV